jgi:hypothetical protein
VRPLTGGRKLSVITCKAGGPVRDRRFYVVVLAA